MPVSSWLGSVVSALLCEVDVGRPRQPRSHRSRRYTRWLPGLLVLPLSVWVLCASRPGLRVVGCPDGCAIGGKRAERALTIVSLNMLHGFPSFTYLEQRIELIQEELVRLAPDIVCLQEVPWRPGMGTAAEHLAKALGYNHIYVRANGNRWAILFEEGEAILSRYPLRDAGLVELGPRAGLFEHRVALRATAATPSGDVQVFVTHLTHSDPDANRGQVAALRAYVAESALADGPAVIAGDFNAPPDSPQIREIGWIDAYLTVNPGDPGLTCCVEAVNSGTDALLRLRIDYVFLEPGAQPPSVLWARRVFAEPVLTDSGYLWPSDHVGVMAAIALRGAQGSGPARD